MTIWAQKVLAFCHTGKVLGDRLRVLDELQRGGVEKKWPFFVVFGREAAAFLDQPPSKNGRISGWPSKNAKKLEVHLPKTRKNWRSTFQKRENLEVHLPKTRKCQQTFQNLISTNLCSRRFEPAKCDDNKSPTLAPRPFGPIWWLTGVEETKFLFRL